jgi:hypothetical protein
MATATTTGMKAGVETVKTKVQLAIAAALAALAGPRCALAA